MRKGILSQRHPEKMSKKPWVSHRYLSILSYPALEDFRMKNMGLVSSMMNLRIYQKAKVVAYKLVSINSLMSSNSGVQIILRSLMLIGIVMT